jgi:hypothetical protein
VATVAIGRWGLRAPDGAEVPNVPLWMQRLAADLSDVAKDNQGTLGARPVSTTLTPGISGRYFTTTDELDGGVARRRSYRDAGTAWDELATLPVSRRMLDAAVVRELPSALLTTAQFLALPAQPDGTVVRVQLVAPTTTLAGINARLRLNAADPSAWKWQVDGLTGPLAASVGVQQSVSTAVWQNLATLGPDVVVPLAAEVEFEIEAETVNGSATLVTSYIGLTVVGGAPFYSPATMLPATANFRGRLQGSERTTVAAGATLRMQYTMNPASSVSWLLRRLRVWPLRVTGPAVA